LFPDSLNPDKSRRSQTSGVIREAKNGAKARCLVGPDWAKSDRQRCHQQFGVPSLTCVSLALHCPANHRGGFRVALVLVAFLAVVPAIEVENQDE
jgi:hypothetical protein